MAEKPTTQNTKKNQLKRLAEFLSHPAQSGRVIKPSEVMAGLGISRNTFYRHIGNMQLAQSWLVINKDAPLDAKKYYQHMLDKELADSNVDVKVKTKTKTLFVSQQEAKTKAARVVALFSPGKEKGGAIAVAPSAVDLGVRVLQTTQSTITVPATQKDVAMQRIRDSYILAAVGDIPNIRKIMLEFGLIDEETGKPAQTAPVTEDEVRALMVLEDWKGMRSDQLHKTLDVIPDEVKMISMIRNLETQKILFDEIKLVHRNNRQFYSKGKVLALDGTPIDWSPDPGTLAGLAEVMRRMIDGGGNINILNINQTIAGAPGGKAGSMSMVTRTYLSKLGTMSHDEVRAEISRFEALSKALSGDTAAITLEDLEEQDDKTIETTGTPVPPKKDE